MGSITIHPTTGMSGVPMIYENATVSATAATGTIQFDITTQSILYYTTNASGNWTLNVRGDASTTFNSLIGIGQTATIAFIVAQGTTAYYHSSLTIDGVTVTPKWQDGATPVAGSASATEIYTFNIVKTANETYTVFAARSRFI
jgi:hypothetical protein